MTLDKSKLASSVDDVAAALRDVATKIHQNPELRFEEHKAAAWLCEAIEEAGVEVERGLAGMPTSFRARVGAGHGPHVAILAEYDALPHIGHACGHNLIAGGALGAFLALAKHASSIEGTIDLLGTPAEEGGGGKIKLIEARVFEGVDAAMMFHPFDRDLLAHPALANVWIEMRFKGTPSHAALAPHEGASALTACLETFRLIDSQRVHFKDGVRVHGFVTNGGQAVNIIPEHAACEFSVRARDVVELARVRAIVERCAKGAALACGVEVEMGARQGYKDMVNNLVLARAFGENMKALGHAPKLHDETVGAGSTDMGDVSHAVPSIHPWLAICDEGETTCHQHAFQKCAGSERGMRAMIDAAKAMAMTAADVLSNPKLVAESRASFEARS